MIVSNATPLIYLAKLGKLELLRRFFKEVYISAEVKREVVDKGKELNAPDAILIEKAIQEKWIKVKKTDILKGLEEFGIDRGEAESISLSLELKCNEILIDQTHARISAKSFGLTPRGTLFVLLKALKHKLITYDEYLECLENLVRFGFRMSDELYLNAIQLGKELRQRNR